MISLNWQAIFNFILFVMIIVAFTFAIWSYVKSNAIKNSNSPSIPQSKVNSNNTYVNNIASAPNLVTLGFTVDNANYKLKSTDNGSNIVVLPTSDNYIVNLDFTDVLGIKGFYIKLYNLLTPNNPLLSTGPYNIILNTTSSFFDTLTYNIPTSQSVYLGVSITDLVTFRTSEIASPIIALSESDITP